MVLNKLLQHRKKVALGVLLAMTVQLVAPLKLRALTSGPAQPEHKGFEPGGMSDLVDSFSGDFNYSIPIMDVGGYPLNLNYHSGSGPDDEASWVGFGWSLTPGSMNRELRGLPDDFNGADKVIKTEHLKDHITEGLTAKVSAKVAGVPVGNFSLSAGVEFDNYRGIGTRLGANAGLSIGDLNSSEENENNQDDDDTLPSGNGLSGGVSLGLSTSSMDGASADLDFNILKKNQDMNESNESIAIGFPYSSRSGLQGMTLRDSYDPGKVATGGLPSAMHLSSPEIGGSSFISFVAPTYTPTIEVPTTTDSYTLNLDAGGEVSFGYIGGGISGYYSNQHIAGGDQTQTMPAYGYMYLEKGKSNPGALMDFNREKDIPYSSEVLYLPVPVPTNDLFFASGEGASGQYTIARGEPGVLFDRHTGTSGNDFSLGVQAGFGDYFSLGGDFYYQNASNQSQKWTQQNRFLPVGDYSTQPTVNTTQEHAYFKRMGEPVVTDEAYAHSFQRDTAVRVVLTGSGATVTATNQLSNEYTATALTQPLGRTAREQRIKPVSYLTASEAALGGLDKTINSYPAGQLCEPGCSGCAIQNIPRVGGYRQGHHLSQITTTGANGERMVYGLPVYNTYTEETSFNVSPNSNQWAEGVINYNPASDATPANTQGTSGYFSKQVTPAYATSFLLTAVLSADYQDLTGDGVTDDDKGSAYKFNYTLENGLYNWRTPVDQNMASYNIGMLNDPRDDKGSYTFGQKELWYLHSIESKTLVALFITENRQDGFGVNDATGGVNTGVPLQRLKEVRLYSKADIQAHNGDYTQATPIRVAHFVYSYSLMPGIPNSLNASTGKLTLKQVYFTFGNGQKGQLNPYTFTYYSENQPLAYHHQMYDRWGNYKDPADNPAGMNNAEYPFTLQDTVETSDFVSRWQLQTVTTPSGGSLTVHYESDDYAYVQDQRASQMCPVTGVNNANVANGLTTANSILVTLPQPVSSQQDLMFRYFQNMTYLFFKVYMDLDGQGHSEFVPGYAKIQSVQLVNSTTASIQLAPDNISGVGNVNPVTSTGWQFIRSNLPQYAYPGYSNIGQPGSDFSKAIKSLATALGNLSELLPNSFPKKAKRNHYSDKIDLTRSFVRLCSPGFRKLGGGARVSRLDISDQWAGMSGTADAKTGTYSEVFNYTTQSQDENGNSITISSGVASYEPLIGGEENPFHQPIFYRQNVLLQLDNYYYVEQPYCESFYPAPLVGYSRVTESMVGTGDAASTTGCTVDEFYTAKDYPTQVSALPMQKIYGRNSAVIRLLFGKVEHSVGLSQGYSVVNNDMHGKPKANSTYNQSGALIEENRYYYRTLNQASEARQLDNHVPLAEPDGSIRQGTVGQDIQVFTDMREDISNNEGSSVRVSGGLAGLLWFPCPFFFPGPGSNYDHRTYHSACTIKVVSDFAIPDRVVRTINGSTITTQTLLWDAGSGDVVLSQTQNEFDDPVYNLHLPAYWMYDRMGAACRNDGAYLSGIQTDATGRITNGGFAGLLVPGDECLDLLGGNDYWVTNSDGNLRLVNRDGSPFAGSVASAKIIRSGRRNILGSEAASFSTLHNPIVGNRLDCSYVTKILTSEALEYNEAWNQPEAYYCRYIPPAGFQLSPDSTYFYQDVAGLFPDDPGDCETACAGDENPQYGVNGLSIYLPGYDTLGNGTLYVSNYTGNSYWNGVSCSGGGGGEAFALKKAASSIQPLATAPATCNMLPSARLDTDCGPLNTLGIWTCKGYGLIRPNEDGRLPATQWIGFSRMFKAPATQTYYLAVGADDFYKVKIDGQTVINRFNATGDFQAWYAYPIQLTKGWHIIEMQAWNQLAGASMAAEIYGATPSQIIGAQGYANLDTIFSTLNMIGAGMWGVATACPAGYAFDLADSNAATPCRKKLPINGYVNPYVNNLLGDWKEQRVRIFRVDREQPTVHAEAGLAQATNIRQAGAYADFSPFWQYNTSSASWTANAAGDARWIAAFENTGVSPNGESIEKKDALNLYGAVLFGYNQSVPVAVASPAEYRDIAFDGFEDYLFNLQCAPAGCIQHHFDFSQLVNGSTVQLSSQQAHTGRYSLQLTGNVTLTRQIYGDNPVSSFSVDATGNYKPAINQWTEGFSPVPGREYLLSCWIRDGQPRQATTPAMFLVNGAQLINSSMTFPIVEGWKRIEVPFVVPQGATTFNLTIQPGGTLYLDDIRICPYNAIMTSTVFDPFSMRVMATLDANDMATFFEYDDEGTRIRTKKETERGIVTVTETTESLLYPTNTQH
ncbi:MAG TPA: hypothetical protein VL547_07515 [Dinghuibacter sp.]|uniref:hypothetical protein n=1 Tax=Dinghuibacter sp. TaxID=2024697 RepID=UPI002CE8F326|nr:hypothetical protein [Dinghuibacter sp.]HTJ11855.1 hypothetical protein [Dinghuibacter sp.]